MRQHAKRCAVEARQDSRQDSEPGFPALRRLPPDVQDQVAALLTEATPLAFDLAGAEAIFRPLAKAAELIDGAVEADAAGGRP